MLILVDSLCIVLFILGLIGNVIGLIVFSSRRFRHTTYSHLALASFILNLLCVFRYSILLNSSTRKWMSIAVAHSWLNCKLYRLSSCLRILSAWITVFWVYERFIYVSNILQSILIKRTWLISYKYYYLTFISFIIILIVTGPNVYFYIPQSTNITLSSEKILSVINTNVSNQSLLFLTSTISSVISNNNRLKDDFNQLYAKTSTHCSFDSNISPKWRAYFQDVSYGFNYYTIRCIFSELIPSIAVTTFNIGIILRISKATCQFKHIIKKKRPTTTTIRKNTKYVTKTTTTKITTTKTINKRRVEVEDAFSGPKTSWMNIVLILHSCLFFFSSLTHTIVYWCTSNALLSYWVSVIILANCSLNFYVYCLSGKTFRQEIRRLFKRYRSKLSNILICEHSSSLHSGRLSANTEIKLKNRKFRFTCKM
ncbi:unnamed protein product [Didymodactylos carnosus]|uniref:G-protein coupled receptors family 1 profile domain-containing protein n=1 Tax=Didymodactylos carnosus TaxID=1234261 RepID=A0A813Z0R9_9BILA|nr:unnamed protein product [Didymodactylos carnosus]CAF1001224.1 unnamed protein product [Didymodactylos carnosus]CAF3675995.1 unnamed protein product [Didymodactylos carnosus]CAF3770625.1 unnamed protein product [Didymodactylos carnosus]